LLILFSVMMVGASLHGEVEFRQWMTKFNKQYDTPQEYQIRLTAFEATLLRLADRQTSEGSATFGLNRFSDMSPEEFAKYYLTFEAPSTQQLPDFRITDNTAEPLVDSVDSFDWRSMGAVSPIKDQGQCGSCWAFSATEEIESMWFLSGNEMPILAPQQIVDCDHSLFDRGCNGGTTQFAYHYVEGAGGLDYEVAYPYVSGNTGSRGTCSFNSTAIGATLTGFTYATPMCLDVFCDHQNEDVLETSLLTTGPVSVCLNARAWQDYSGGVMSGRDCGGHALFDLDHCVQLIGFNATVDQAQPYWIVRNSWGENWGEAGTIYLEIGDNTCGLANMATQVVI